MWLTVNIQTEAMCLRADQGKCKMMRRMRRQMSWSKDEEKRREAKGEQGEQQRVGKRVQRAEPSGKERGFAVSRAAEQNRGDEASSCQLFVSFCLFHSVSQVE